MREDQAELEEVTHDAVFGWLLLAVGLGLLGWGALFDPTAASDAYLGERLINIGELAKKMAILGAGGLVIVIGAVILAAHAIRSDLRRMSKREGINPPSAK